VSYIANQVPYETGATYAAGAVVSYSDASYTSIQPPMYAAATTYAVGAIATYNGVTYTSPQAANTGNEPDTSPTWWSPTPNTGNEPDTSPAWWAPHDSSLPSWTLDSYFNVIASN